MTELAPMTLRWRRFTTFIEARNTFKTVACVYVQADGAGRSLRVGKASKGLASRYRGGTGYALEAAMHGSGNDFFVAEVPEALCGPVEEALIWRHRQQLAFNNQGKKQEPRLLIEVVHEGESVPEFEV